MMSVQIVMQVMKLGESLLLTNTIIGNFRQQIAEAWALSLGRVLLVVKEKIPANKCAQQDHNSTQLPK